MVKLSWLSVNCKTFLPQTFLVYGIRSNKSCPECFKNSPPPSQLQPFNIHGSQGYIVKTYLLCVDYLSMEVRIYIVKLNLATIYNLQRSAQSFKAHFAYHSMASYQVSPQCFQSTCISPLQLSQLLKNQCPVSVTL